MYKESYLRFSSQEYNLLNYHESVHLTNHAIQKKYVNGQRDDRLPAENMWDCHTFQAYLRMIGKLELWAERIYPGMQRAIIGSMLASQENMDRRPNTFELFGADFMVSEDFYPWLIEINSSPDLGSTTSVTARLCPQCLEDTVKVVIDRRNDPKADTGGFELIYRQSIPPAPAYMGLNLFLKGQQLLTKNTSTRRSHDTKYREDLRIISRPVPRTAATHQNSSGNPGITTTQGPYIMDLMDCLNLKPNQVSPKTRKTSPSTILRKVVNKTSRGTQSSNTRITNSSRKNEQKPAPKVDSQRRHASCGPRIVVVQEEPLPSEEKKVSQKEITCIGNRYCPEKLESTSTPTSSRTNQPIQESMIFKSKSASNIFSKLRNSTSVNQRSSLSPYRSLTKSSTIGTSGRRDDEQYCSHFFAVGLSLRAWRAKYNKILNSQKENLPTPLIKSCSPKPQAPAKINQKL